MTDLSCDDVQPRLSGYLDGEIGAAEAETIRRHLVGCATCEGVLGDLRRVREAARDLAPVAPPATAWQAIRQRTRAASAGPEDTPARRAGSAGSGIWQWAGLAAAILLITSVAYLLGPRPPADRGSASPATGPAVATTAPPEPGALSDELDAAVAHYERAIAVLQTAAAAGNEALDPAAAEALAADETALDRAIAESRAALVASPDNEPARYSLFEALRRKIARLQATVTLINEMNQGDPAGAAKAAEGLRSQS